VYGLSGENAQRLSFPLQRFLLLWQDEMIIWEYMESTAIAKNKTGVFRFKTNNLFKKYTLEICRAGDNFGHLFLFGESVPFLLVFHLLRPIIPSKRTQNNDFVEIRIIVGI